ncbi:MAG: hypothetical protein EXR73_06505 [Myxococcales bacterium]|nr:hypothetical protein [Myxococcales bacterium]
MSRTAWLALVTAAALTAACTDPIDAGSIVPDAGSDDDPLAGIVNVPTPGSLDELHERIIARSCAGQPGLCHAGQFEPDLSTPANFFHNLVNRPGLEQHDRLRVQPGAPDDSLLIDKLRGRNDVTTVMPLGAEQLAEADLLAIERWIDDGALRTPDADAAPVLNNPPMDPEVGLFDESGERLDGYGATLVAVGTPLTFRMSVRDFETPDSMIPFVGLVLQLPDGRAVILSPEAKTDPQTGVATFDAAGPMGAGDLLDFRFDWIVPADLLLVGGEAVPAATAHLNLFLFYLDEFTMEGIIAIRIVPDFLELE